MKPAIVALCLSGCASMQVLPKDQPCVEAGFAISRRTYECTEDAELANARFVQFEDDYDCVDIPDWELVSTEDGGSAHLETTGGVEVPPQDWFHCAFAIGQLPCELVLDYGDDLDRWLAVSDTCEELVVPAGGGA